MVEISIIIPTLNSAKTINRCLSSVINQSYKNFEIIILDSFSTDKTIKIIKSLKSKKIKIYKISRAYNLSKIRYCGIKFSLGRYICFLDSDDFWHKEKLKKQRFFMKEKKAIFSSTNFTLVKNKLKKKFFSPEIINFNDLIYSRPIANSSVMVNKNIILQVAKKFQNVEYAEDYLWWLKIAEKTKIYNHKKNLTFIRVSENSRTLKGFFKNISSLYNIYRAILKFNNCKIVFIFLILVYKNFTKKMFYLTK